MNHYVYLITNNINGMKYIGKRSCNEDIEKDSYMGGGTKLKEAQKEYGINNFSKKILALAFDEAMAFELENYYIKKADAVESKDYYNETYGGTGSSMFYHEDPERRKRVRQILSEKNKGKNAGANSGKAKKVICINNKKIFDTEKQACESIGRKAGYISKKSNKYYNKLKRGLIVDGCSAGVDKETEEALYWLYYDEYEKYILNDDLDFNVEKDRLYVDEKIICLNDLKIYKSLKEVNSIYNVNITEPNDLKINHTNTRSKKPEKEFANYIDFLSKISLISKDKSVFRYNENKPVICINNNITYNSLADVSNDLKIPIKEILLCCCTKEPSRKLKYLKESMYEFRFYDDYTEEQSN